MITQHPQSQTVAMGATAQFSVAATGQAPLTYRWQRNGVSLNNGGHFSGVTTSNLTVSNVDNTVTGSYRCVVTNAGGCTTSNAATLALAAGGTCSPDSETLCLFGGRFAAELTWFNPNNGQSGAGKVTPHPSSDLGGFFWFSSANNIEVAVKVVDGRLVNGSFWVFYGNMTTLQYTLTITDTIAGTVNVYQKTSADLCGGADTGSFPGRPAPGRPALGDLAGALGPLPIEPPGGPLTEAGNCSPGANHACLLNDRFQVEVLRSGAPQPAIELTAITGIFSFTNGSPTNPEVMVKAIDGTGLNGKYWIFYGSLTSQDYQVRVTDTLTGAVKTYTPPAPHCGEADTNAF